MVKHSQGGIIQEVQRSLYSHYYKFTIYPDLLTSNETRFEAGIIQPAFSTKVKV
jgi:hypothetical protein